MAGRKAARPEDKNLGFLKFNSMTSNAYILVLSRFLALITYQTNLVLPLVLQCNIVEAANIAAL